MGGAEDGAQHQEIHLVVPVVMRLVEPGVVDLRFVGHDQPAKAQPVIRKEQVNQSQIETDLGRGNLGPLGL